MSTEKIKGLAHEMARTTTPYLQYIQDLQERYDHEWNYYRGRAEREPLEAGEKRVKAYAAPFLVASGYLAFVSIASAITGHRFTAPEAATLASVAMGTGAAGMAALGGIGWELVRPIKESKMMEKLREVSRPSLEELEAADVAQRLNLQAHPSSPLARLWDRAMSSIGLREEQPDKESLVHHVMHSRRMAERP